MPSVTAHMDAETARLTREAIKLGLFPGKQAPDRREPFILQVERELPHLSSKDETENSPPIQKPTAKPKAKKLPELTVQAIVGKAILKHHDYSEGDLRELASIFA